MRTVQTFILRLLVDEDDPHALRGALRAISQAQEYPFADEQSFLNLLHHMIQPPNAIPVNEKGHGLT
jgi:hypothetical protein